MTRENQEHSFGPGAHVPLHAGQPGCHGHAPVVQPGVSAEPDGQECEEGVGGGVRASKKLTEKKEQYHAGTVVTCSCSH